MFETVLIAKRADDGTPETDEIRGLAEAAGCAVVGKVTQTRPADPGQQFGDGAVERLADLVAETGADAVVVDNELTPRQSVTLEDGTGARVVDRHRVVLEIFAERARTRRARLQVELARLRYRLPRVREASDEGMLNRWTESGTPLYDLHDRIDGLQRKLDALPDVDEHRRERRREEGFDLVAIAGYTNAGKTTLLRRLADEVSLAEESHPDLDETATVENRLFETLETTTRRATIEGRRVLLTDTVGFLDDLPHWLVESFRGTLDEVAEADAVLLVADASESIDELRRKLETAREAVPEAVPTVTAFNKCDRLDDDAIATRCEALADLAPDPVGVNALEGDLTELRTRLDDALPDLRHERLELPLTDDAMSLVSWIHDRAVDAEVEYGAEEAVVEFEGRPATVRKAQARATELE